MIQPQNSWKMLWNKIPTALSNKYASVQANWFQTYPKHSVFECWSQIIIHNNSVDITCTKIQKAWSLSMRKYHHGCLILLRHLHNQTHVYSCPHTASPSRQLRESTAGQQDWKSLRWPAWQHNAYDFARNNWRDKVLDACPTQTCWYS